MHVSQICLWTCNYSYVKCILGVYYSYNVVILLLTSSLDTSARMCPSRAGAGDSLTNKDVTGVGYSGARSQDHSSRWIVAVANCGRYNPNITVL